MIKNSLLALVLMISFNANAWWDTGHEMVCSEAYNLLSPAAKKAVDPLSEACLLYTSPSPRDVEESRMPSSA